MQPSANQDSEPTVSKEIVQNIPVKSQAPVQNANIDGVINPVASAQGTSQTKTDKNLDNILKDVNAEVKKPKDKKVVRIGKDGKQQAGPVKTHFVPVILAFTVAIILSVAAFYAFKQDSSSGPKSTASTQPSADTQPTTAVTQKGIDSLNQSIESSINDIQTDSDFSQESLSDSALGL